MKKQPERTARTRRQLIGAFWQLYCEKRIEKITVKEIADNAGVYRSTFYEYFSDVYDVLQTIEDELMDELMGRFGMIFMSTDLDAAIEIVLEFYEKNGEKMAVLLGSGGDQGFYIALTERVKALLCANTRADSEDPRIEMLFAVLPTTVVSLLQYWYAHRDTVNLRDVLLLGSQFVKEGLLPTMKELGVPFLK